SLERHNLHSYIWQLGRCYQALELPAHDGRPSSKTFDNRFVQHEIKLRCVVASQQASASGTEVDEDIHPLTLTLRVVIVKNLQDSRGILFRLENSRNECCFELLDCRCCRFIIHQLKQLRRGHVPIPLPPWILPGLSR